MTVVTWAWTLLLALSSDFLQRPSDEHLLAAAHEAFARGVQLRQAPEQARSCFREAADLFEQARRRGLNDPALFLNQGNACLLADDLPGAILAYRRGLRLAPHNRDLQQHLAFAREQVAYPSPGPFARPPVESRPPWLPRLPVRWGLGIAFVAYGLGWVCLTRWRMRRQGRFLSFGLGCFALAVVVVTALAVEEAARRADERFPLVVIAHDGVLLRKGNGEAYPRKYETPVNRGVEARRLFERGGWVQIELSGGQTGWVPREYVLIAED